MKALVACWREFRRNLKLARVYRSLNAAARAGDTAKHLALQKQFLELARAQKGK